MGTSCPVLMRTLDLSGGGSPLGAVLLGKGAVFSGLVSGHSGRDGIMVAGFIYL